MANPDRAGRAIAGLLGYNPGPGIYSRLERAVEQMPESVRVQELPGLLKRYKEGVPGWELKATDLDSTIAGRDVVPRDELLAAVRERSPVHTHGEVILGGRPQIQHVPTGETAYYYDAATDTRTRLPDPTRPVPDYQFPDTGEVSRLGDGVSHGEPRYRDYGQGGKDYTELLIHQPGPRLPDYGNHWDGDTPNAVAHARFDTHGDALRINELQSDLGIHNRKARESLAEEMRTGRIRDSKVELPFPLEDAWAEILIKRLALEAARKGHRAIEVASPRAIADKVGGNIENYEHFYGKVVPGALERLGRKMGGLTPDSPPDAALEGMSAVDAWMRARGMHRPAQFGYDEAHDLRRLLNEQFPSGRDTGSRGVGDSAYHLLERARTGAESADPVEQATYLRDVAWRNFEKLGAAPEDAMRMADEAMPEVLRHYEAMRSARNRYWDYGEQMTSDVANPARSVTPPGRRYIMSDAMRRNLIEKGVGASVLAPLMMQEE